MPNPAAPIARQSLAIVACAFDLSAMQANGNWIQLMPAGEFLPNDGRPMEVDAWRIDEAVATRVIARWRARKNRIVIDYEHQTLHKERNGQPAPAAAWIVDMQWRPDGLWAQVELTQRAADAIAAREYLYVSPVFVYDVASGEVLEVIHAALTNTAAIEGMQPLAALAAATFGFNPQTQEVSMNKNLVAAIVSALSLGADTTEDQAIAACASIKPKLETLNALLADLKVKPDGENVRADALAACSSLRTASATTATPDPAKFVPVEAVNALQTQVASLNAIVAARQVEEVLAPALADGRVPKALEAWARELGNNNLAALTQYIANAQPIAALTGTQTNGQPPAGVKDANGLSQEELAVCSASGIDPKTYAETKAAIAA